MAYWGYASSPKLLKIIPYPLSLSQIPGPSLITTYVKTVWYRQYRNRCVNFWGVGVGLGVGGCNPRVSTS